MSSRNLPEVWIWIPNGSAPCPDCLDMEEPHVGQEPERPHPNCRCSIELVDDPEEIAFLASTSIEELWIPNAECQQECWQDYELTIEEGEPFSPLGPAHYWLCEIEVTVEFRGETETDTVTLCIDRRSPTEVTSAEVTKWADIYTLRDELLDKLCSRVCQ